MLFGATEITDFDTSKTPKTWQRELAKCLWTQNSVQIFEAWNLGKPRDFGRSSANDLGKTLSKSVLDKFLTPHHHHLKGGLSFDSFALGVRKGILYND